MLCSKDICFLNPVEEKALNKAAFFHDSFHGLPMGRHLAMPMPQRIIIRWAISSWGSTSCFLLSWGKMCALFHNQTSGENCYLAYAQPRTQILTPISNNMNLSQNSQFAGVKISARRMFLFYHISPHVQIIGYLRIRGFLLIFLIASMYSHCLQSSIYLGYKNLPNYCSWQSNGHHHQSTKS